MPQMSPMNWICLFFYFLVIFIIMNILNYYIFSPFPKTSKKTNIILNSNNWKW